MIPPECDARSWACDLPECEHHVPPVPGDALRRRPVCGFVLVEEAVRVGGVEQRTIAWLLGISESRVSQIVSGELVKIRRKLERAA